MKNTLETRLGIFFALALVVAVLILEMVGAADFFKRGYQINSSFKTAQELKKGDLVKMAGVEIGRVEGIELVASRAKVTMKIQGKYEIKTDSKAVIKFTGLMGQNFVSVENGTSDAPKLAPGGSLDTIEQPDLSAIMVKLENVASGVEGLTKSFSAENMSTLLGPITDFMKQNSTNLGEIFKNTRSVTEQIAQGKGTVGKLIYDESLYNSASATVSLLQGAAGEAKTMMTEAQTMIGQARGIIDQINSGQGSVGKFVKEDAFYQQTTNAMMNLGQILEKINRGQGTVGQLINDSSFLKNAKLSLQKLDKATEGLEDQGPLSVLGIAVNSLF
jgi:phospholipid/cholesterol/gamma-HCH transport system substrate-binding protein